MSYKFVFRFLLLILLSTQAKLISSLNLKCEYPDLNNLFCDLNFYVEVLQPNTKIGSLYSFYDVATIYKVLIKDQKISYVPTGLEKYFAHIKVLRIQNTPLKEIRQQNLKDFRQLKFLEIFGTHIESIDGNLFDFNLEIESLHLQNNRINFIVLGAFDKLAKLKFISLVDNTCFSRFLDFSLSVDNLVAPGFFAGLYIMCSRNEYLKIIWKIMQMRTLTLDEISYLKKASHNSLTLGTRIDELTLTGNQMNNEILNEITNLRSSVNFKIHSLNEIYMGRNEAFGNFSTHENEKFLEAKFENSMKSLQENLNTTIKEIKENLKLMNEAIEKKLTNETFENENLKSNDFRFSQEIAFGCLALLLGIFILLLINLALHFCKGHKRTKKTESRIDLVEISCTDTRTEDQQFSNIMKKRSEANKNGRQNFEVEIPVEYEEVQEAIKNAEYSSVWNEDEENVDYMEVEENSGNHENLKKPNLPGKKINFYKFF